MNQTHLLSPSTGPQNQQILLVDDQPDVRDVLRAHLEQAGYRVIEAADGAEALGLVRDVLPELILIDIYMPEMNGISLCKRLRQVSELAQTPLLLVTGFASDEILQQALEAGASDYVTKPVAWPLLHHRIRALLRAKESEATAREHERRWRQLATDLPGLIYRTAPLPTRPLLSVSPGCLALTGYLPETLLSPAFPGYSILLHPGDRESAWAQVEAALAQREPFALTYRLLTATGSEKLVWEKGHGIYGPRNEVEALEGIVLPFPVVERVLES